MNFYVNTNNNNFTLSPKKPPSTAGTCFFCVCVLFYPANQFIQVSRELYLYKNKTKFIVWPKQQHTGPQSAVFFNVKQ